VPAGDQGKKLELAAAKATWALRPRHTFVPWIVVNGVALGGDFERLERYVCAAAPAAARPPACYDLPEGLKHMG
jgi:interferon gamma-inducible protein 30